MKHIVIVEHSNQRIDIYIRNQEKAKQLYQWNKQAFPKADINIKELKKDSLKKYIK